LATDFSIVAGIAHRYATALFDLARDQGVLDAVDQDLDALDRLLAESADLGRLVRSPLIGRQAQAGAMAAILERAGAEDLVRRFVGVVANNRRLFALPGMIRDWRALLARHRGETVAEVTSAMALDEAQTAAVKRALTAAVGRDVTVATKVDAGLIGGLVVKVGSLMVDSSLRTKLHRLRLAMKEVG